MPAPSEKPLARLCIRIFEEDYNEIKSIVAASGGAVSSNELIRTIIHSYVTQMRAKQRQNLDRLRPETLDIDLDEIINSK